MRKCFVFSSSCSRWNRSARRLIAVWSAISMRCKPVPLFLSAFFAFLFTFELSRLTNSISNGITWELSKEMYFFRLRLLNTGAGLGSKLTKRGRISARWWLRQLTEPFQLYTSPVCRPKRMGAKSVSNYLSQFRLSFYPVCICHLSQALRDPISEKVDQICEMLPSCTYLSCGGQESDDMICK